MPARPRGRIGSPPPVEEPPVERIYAGRIFRRGRITPAEIGVDGNGIIRRVAKDLRGAPRQDFGEGILLPSGVDLHVHFRDPSPPGAVEDLSSGTVQAALGGIAAVVDMPNTDPPITTLARLEEKIARIPARAFVDVLPYAAVTTRERIPLLAPRAAGFKLYMSPTTGDIPPPAGEEIPGLLTEIAGTGLPLHVHAEDPSSFAQGKAPREPREWDLARPPESEESALRGILKGPDHLRLHVAHVTTTKAAQMVREWGGSFEATPHHLLLSTSRIRNAMGKVNPPLRTEERRRELWEEFRAGKIPVLASDHAPHPLGEKEKRFDLAPAGVPGVETMLPLLLERVRAGEIELGTLWRAASRRPGLFLGLPWGRIAPGYEANLLVVDFRQRRRISARSLHAPCGWTPYEGWEGIFPVEHHLRGERIVEDGEFVGRRRGRVRRPFEPETPRLPPAAAQGPRDR